MSRWMILICCASLVSLEAKHLSHHDYGHHAAHGKHSLHTKEVEDSEENSESNKEENKNVCQTEVCHQTAQFIKKSMDQSVDPCQDFERYACGKWAENYKIPAYKSSWSPIELVEENINYLLKEMLSKAVESDDILPVKLAKKWYKSCVDIDELERKGVRSLLNVLARIGGWPMSMEPNEWDEDAYTWQRVDEYYARLTGTITFAQTKVVPSYIERLLRGDKKTPMALQIQVMELPMMEEKSESRFKRSSFSAGDDYKRLIEEVAVDIVRERGVDVPREAILNDIEDMLKFEEKLYDMLIRLPSDYLNIDDANVEQSSESKESDEDSSDSASKTSAQNSDESDSQFGNDSDNSAGNDSNDTEDKSDNSVGNDSNKDSDSGSDDSIPSESCDEVSESKSDSEDGSNGMEEDGDSNDSEDDLRKIRKNKKKNMKKRAKKYLRRHILSEYSDEEEDDDLDVEKEEFWAMNLWGNSLQAIFKEANVDRESIDINDLVSSDYLRKIYTLLEKTPKRVIVNYVHWKFINGMVRHTTEKLREMYFDVKGKNLGKTEPEPRWVWCIQQIGMKDILSYEYVKNYFPDANKEMANNMIKKIRSVIKEEIDRSPWMSEELKKAAKEKLYVMKAEVGYPDWYDNSTAIEHYYKGLVINRNYFDNMLNYKKYNYIKKLRMMSATTNFMDDDWFGISPLTMNAIYAPWSNSLVVTAVNFHRPFFDVSQPAAVNFGIVGFTFSHEISHGFDPFGRNFDKDGDYVEWNKEDDKNYEKREKCYVEMYSNYTIELEAENRTIKVDGEKTSGDNIADCLGLEAVHEAYKLWIDQQKDKKDLRLPGFENFDDDQLFFLASASIWCESVKPEFAKFVAKVDEHSPNRVRILAPISNSEHFGRAFNCPKGSPMNPETKCRIWE